MLAYGHVVALGYFPISAHLLDDQGPELQCLLKFKVDLKIRMGSLAYENWHLEITEIITISCIL